MTLPATREAAMIAGSQLYDTMKPCRRGHSSPRYTSNAICVVCKKAHAKSPSRVEADSRRAMLPKSWKEAQEKGAARYFTGLKCRKGHISERATSNGGCIECGKERHAKAGGSDQGDGMTLSERILAAAKNKVPVSKIIKSLPQHKAKNVRTEIDNMTRHGGPLERFKDGSVQSRVVVDNSGRPVFGKNRNMAWFNATLEDVRNRLGVG